MTFAQYYENQITEKLDEEERRLWQEFYDTILSERIKRLSRNYKGRSSRELRKAIKEFEEIAVGEYQETIDEQLTTLCDKLRTQAYFDALNRLDKISEDMPDNPKLDSQPLATETTARHVEKDYYINEVARMMKKIQSEQILRYIWCIVSDIYKDHGEDTDERKYNY